MKSDFFVLVVMQNQLQSLQSFVNELSDQNEILVQTVEELEREANDRVALVESKLQKTTLSLKVNERCFILVRRCVKFDL